MPILLPFLLFALLFALVWCAVQLYSIVAAYAGLAGGVLALLIAAGLIISPILFSVRRYLAIYGRTKQGQRLLATVTDWGSIRIDANKKRGEIHIKGGISRAFIFADIVAVEDKQGLRIRLQHPEQVVELPFSEQSERRRWRQILILSARQQL